MPLSPFAVFCYMSTSAYWFCLAFYRSIYFYFMTVSNDENITYLAERSIERLSFYNNWTNNYSQITCFLRIFSWTGFSSLSMLLPSLTSKFGQFIYPYLNFGNDFSHLNRLFLNVYYLRHSRSQKTSWLKTLKVTEITSKCLIYAL